MDTEEIIISSDEDTSNSDAIIKDFRNILIQQVTGKPVNESEIEIHDPADSEDEEFDDNEDFVMEYLKKLLGENEEIDPEDVENTFKGNHLIEELNGFIAVLASVLSENVGITFDNGREMTFFSDYYVVYVTFVLQLDQTLIDGFLGQLAKNPNIVTSSDIENEFIAYLINDDFAPMEMIRSLSDIDHSNAYYEQIDDYLAMDLLFIPWEIFNEYIRNYVTSNRLSTNLIEKIKKSL